ncbi:MAG: SCO family protein [Gammaproteobacteria bacterium]|nr:SCO family protein [Gammaproteobacteria bacterium]
MAQFTPKKLISLLAMCALVSGAALLILYQAMTRITVDDLRNDGFFIYDVPIEVDPFSLVDHTGAPFTRQSLQERWTLIFFGYTFCPDICPITLASIRQFHDLLVDSGENGEVQVVLVSVDPERDTQEVLSNYVTYFNPEFLGARGEYAQTHTLARNMNVSFSYTRIDDENYLVNHNGEIMLLDPDGNNVGFFKAPHDPRGMLENFQAVKKFLD